MSGLRERDPDDPGFIEMVTFPMPSDGVLLLCSDGLTDLVTSAEIRAGMERYAPDYDAAIRALIDAANNAGGKDNITVVIVAGAGLQTGATVRTRTESPPHRASKPVSLGAAALWFLLPVRARRSACWRL